MATKATVDNAFSYWQTLIDNFQISPLQFYQAVEAHLRDRHVPETENARVDYQEGGLLSANREYLHITREKLAFDICGAPFGTSFFVSWWLSETKPYLAGPLKAVILLGMVLAAAAAVDQIGWWALLAIALLVPGLLYVVHDMTVNGTLNDDFIRVLPLIGPLYERLFKPNTYYRFDTMVMFQTAVHRAVCDVIDELTQAKGLRALSEAERKPILREFYRRKAA